MADVLPCIGQTMQQESKQGIVPRFIAENVLLILQNNQSGGLCRHLEGSRGANRSFTFQARKLLKATQTM
jgi:hypothetical protein